MAHYPLGTLAGATADDLLDALWLLLSGQTAHGWTWARQGTTLAIYGTRAVTGGTLVVAIAGDLAGSTPGGTIAPDTALANKVWIGTGFVPTASTFTWAGWTAANPMTEGTWLGWSSYCVPTTGTIANKIEATTTEGLFVVRLEGTSTFNARIAIMGDIAIPLAAAALLGPAITPQAHGACIGLWSTPEGSGCASTWLNAIPGSGVFGFHSASAAGGHGWLLDGSTRTAMQIELPVKVAPSATSGIGTAAVGGPVALIRLADGPNDRVVAYSPHIAGAALTLETSHTVGGLAVAHWVRRDSASASQALGLRVARAASPGI